MGQHQESSSPGQGQHTHSRSDASISQVMPLGSVGCLTLQTLNAFPAEGVGVQAPTLPLLPTILPILALQNEDKPHRS